MQGVRIAYSLAYLLLGAFGLWRIRRRPSVLLLALLLAAAGSLVLLQSYGGEVVLRIFVFAAPVLAPLTAVAIAALAERGPSVLPLSVVPLAVVLFVYGVLGTTARGVNVSFERVTPDDLRAARALDQRFHHGDTVGVFFTAGALGFDRGDQIHTVPFDPASCRLGPLACALDVKPRFIVVSPAQDAALELVEGTRPGTASAAARELVRRHIYSVAFQHDGTSVLELIPKASRS
jgi:hypothetical protein